MIRNLYIVGAGGFGRELAFWLKQHPDYGMTWSLKGFLDDNAKALDGIDFPYAVVGRIEDFQPAENDLFICAIGVPKIKKEIIPKLQKRGAKFLSFIHPSVIMGEKVALGEGVVLCPGVILTSCLQVGDFAMMNCLSSAGHDVTIGDYSTISGHCDLTSYTTLEEAVFLGSGATLLPKVRVGQGATVGAGAVVVQRVKPGQTVFGNPARVIA